MHKKRILTSVCGTVLLLLMFPTLLPAQAFVMGSLPSFKPVNLGNARTIDDVLLEVRYQLNWRYEGDSQTHADIRTVQIGRHLIYSRSESLYQNDSIATVQLAKGAKGVQLYNTPVVPYEVVVDSQKKKMDIGYRVPFDNMLLMFEENTNTHQWDIKEEEKQVILGYSCTQATTYYRGQLVTAWFSESLPYNAGPYCFHGLPGLIMKVEMDGLSWNAVGLRKGKEKEHIYTYARPRQLMPREKAVSFLARLYDDPVATFSALGVECSNAQNPDITLTAGELKWEKPELLILEQ